MSRGCRSIRNRFGSFAAMLGLLGCSERGVERPREQAGSLDKGVVAKVDGLVVPSSFVLEVAKRHDLEAREARDRVVADALFAVEARKRFEGTGLVRTVERAVWADALLGELRSDAERAGPATMAELAELRRERWVELDRPVSVATVHAVALVKKPEDDQAAARVAEKIHEATQGLSDPKAFAKAARAVPHEGIEVHVEALPHLTPDGRAVQFDPGVPVPSGGFDKAFAAAAHAIPKEGEQSPVVKTHFGYHVILLLERVDAQRYTDDELRKQFGADVVRARAKGSLKRLTSELEGQVRVERSRNFQQLTALLWGQR